MNSILRFKGSLLALVAAFGMLVIASCNKNFDEPPFHEDPNLPVTMTIKDLKARYASRENFQTINDDQVIAGVVVADDRSGNFYQQIVIQDETGGIPIRMNSADLYTKFPVGRKVYVKLRDLMLGDYGGLIQLGMDSSRGSNGRLNLGLIPTALIDSFVIRGSYGHAVTPKVIKPSDLTTDIQNPYYGMLVQINNAEFRDADIVKTYANPTDTENESARNFTIKPCDDNKSIVLRNSSYADFAGYPVPQGNGPLVGIATIFNTTIQIAIRDTADVQFKGPRCNGQVPVGSTKTIAEVLQYATGDSTIPGGVWIEGVIVSDTKNEAAGNYRLQEGTSGIQVRFANGSNPSPGALEDKLKVYVGGQRFSIFSGGLQINGAEVSSTTGAGTVVPRVATIAQIAQSMRAWESTVVKIDNVTFAQSGTTSTGIIYTVTDATGSLKTSVRTASGITMPTTATSVTGYVNVYQSSAGSPEAQITLRTQDDIVGGVVVPPSSGPFTATYNFALLQNNSGTTDPTAPPTVANLTFSNFTAVGLSANSSAGGRFSFSGWPLGATNGSDVFTGDIDISKYYEITITPASGTKLDLSKLTFTFQRSGTGTRQAVVRASVDNFATNLPASIDPTNANLTVVPTNVLQVVADATTSAQDGSTITFGSSHTNLTAPVVLRFYGLNAEASGGTFSIDNVVITGTTH